MKRIEPSPLLRCSGLFLAAAFLALSLASLGSCFFDTKTTLCESSGLRCKPGQTCAASEAACIDIGGCGDNLTSGDEFCDDGNISGGDGCSADCMSNEECGNDIIDLAVGERCDGGNREPNDGCNEKCQPESCGDFVTNKNLDEECDTGAIDSAGCDKDCRLPVCGDDYHNMAAEPCEAPGLKDTVVCNKNCTLRECGDQYTNTAINPATNRPIEACDLGGSDQAGCNGNSNVDGTGNCQIPRCGDGYKNPLYKPLGGSTAGELCDEGGNSADCNGNDHDNDDEDDYADEDGLGAGNCQKARCGDGYVNPELEPTGAGGELCDDADNNTNDDCPSGPSGSCRPAFCGDGFLKTTTPGDEECETLGNLGCGSGQECFDCSRCIEAPPPPT